jgi:hypothetical protein
MLEGILKHRCLKTPVKARVSAIANGTQGTIVGRTERSDLRRMSNTQTMKTTNPRSHVFATPPNQLSPHRPPKKTPQAKPAALLSDAVLKRLPNRHPKRPRLIRRKAKPCATTAFPVKGEQRLLVGDVVDVEACGESALEVHPCTEVELVIAG